VGVAVEAAEEAASRSRVSNSPSWAAEGQHEYEPMTRNQGSRNRSKSSKVALSEVPGKKTPGGAGTHTGQRYPVHV